MSAQPQFWSDDFDMDLPKVIPDARDRLGEHADLELVTYGGTTHGRLNHPCVWNHPLGSVSFFGRGDPRIPSDYYHGHKELVKCTLWEAVRDAWPHSNVILFECRPIWKDQWEHFEPLMSHLRGWRELPEREVTNHKDAVIHALECCRIDVDRIVREGGPSRG
ncbi:MAG TPA: hypothetical protein VJA26_05425 [Gammaproteobacteria bacterium]|nr:hypothetical protein [Gammaproteobacteria bacterium]